MVKAETDDQALRCLDMELVKAERLWSDYVALASKMQSRVMEPEYGADKFRPLIDRLTAQKVALLQERFPAPDAHDVRDGLSSRVSDLV